MKYSVEEPFRLNLFAPDILYMLYKHGASRVQNLVTERGEILQTQKGANTSR